MVGILLQHGLWKYSENYECSVHMCRFFYSEFQRDSETKKEGSKEGGELTLKGGRLETQQGITGPYQTPLEGLAESWHMGMGKKFKTGSF